MIETAPSVQAPAWGSACVLAARLPGGFPGADPIGANRQVPSYGWEVAF